MLRRENKDMAEAATADASSSLDCFTLDSTMTTLSRTWYRGTGEVRL
jgi:hypothetical protein